MTNSLDILWQQLEEANLNGSSKLLHPDSIAKFYCSLDENGNRGLILLSSVEPPASPRYSSVEVLVGKRNDNLWTLGLWLRNNSLKAVFSQLCQGIVAASSSFAENSRASAAINYLIKAQELLEDARGTLLPHWRLRGLIGELATLKACLKFRTPPDVIASWVGPYSAPQDFTFRSQFIEAKAILPSSSTITITSADQLDPPDGIAMMLSVLVLADLPPDSRHGLGISVSDLIDDIANACEPFPMSLDDFQSRLTAANYMPDPYYDETRFTIDAHHFFNIHQAFPRIRRRSLDEGITEVTYRISLAKCFDYKMELTLNDS